jgi:hypothetical protein
MILANPNRSRRSVKYFKATTARDIKEIRVLNYRILMAMGVSPTSRLLVLFTIALMIAAGVCKWWNTPTRLGRAEPRQLLPRVNSSSPRSQAAGFVC